MPPSAREQAIYSSSFAKAGSVGVSTSWPSTHRSISPRSTRSTFGMGSPTYTRPSSSSNSSSKRGGAPSLRFAWAFLAVLLLVLLCCPPCQGRTLPAEEEQAGSMVMRFQVGLVLKLSPSASGYNGGGEAAAAPRGFSRAARSMRSVPSPGVGH